ncbi:putative ETHYLENE INSENSITIVE 3-like 4 protein [Salvia hispanica]|uniref:putative ETHYLENE INSENSITIVE 3-like 4 protein n=1 Tax=Salvia hispanica TaxID=49212 RepID=UPI002009A38B|nr:putative ETHYLENE INSENSITIVE 3-like 4 protein [Salvia hispanica]
MVEKEHGGGSGASASSTPPTLNCRRRRGHQHADLNRRMWKDRMRMQKMKATLDAADRASFGIVPEKSQSRGPLGPRAGGRRRSADRRPHCVAGFLPRAGLPGPEIAGLLHAHAAGAPGKTLGGCFLLSQHACPPSGLSPGGPGAAGAAGGELWWGAGEARRARAPPYRKPHDLKKAWKVSVLPRLCTWRRFGADEEARQPVQVLQHKMTAKDTATGGRS